MRRVYIRTDDFRLAHRLLRFFESKEVSATHLHPDEEVPDADDWWFGTAEEVERLGGNGVAVDPERIEEWWLDWELSHHRNDGCHELVVGVDPGPRPGIAWLSDGRIMGETTVERLDLVSAHLQRLMKALEPHRVLVRIGDGSPAHRDRLINQCLSLGLHVQVVNEHRTSSGTTRHHHGRSAAKIARVAGQEVHEWRSRNATSGELKHLQHDSRQHSQGRVTISKSSAQKVNEGLLSMAEALELAGYDASSNPDESSLT